MPKQIKNLDTRIVDIGRDLFFEKGYSAFSMREVASRCDIAVGTIYNYYKSKDELIAKIAFKDWKNTVNSINSKLSSSIDFVDGMMVTYEEIKEFRAIYSHSFISYAEHTESKAIIVSYHPYLRNEISRCIDVLVPKTLANRDSMLLMLSEMLISCATNEDIHDKDLITLLKAIDIH